ncbi:hypothetical protein DSO57_1014226 [Entomophthora muscae]|uniref:Uncharacterized protein n=1 Tax=Entomophthora muscae TaxID=34485 RepID=A0ACC2SUP1_9FUNG|nr:hypothetical protein DSO57_1014226 [Entomophthora muscae]
MLTAQKRPAILYQGHYFYSKNIFRSSALKQFKYEYNRCPSVVVTNKFRFLKTPPDDHEHPPPKDLFKPLMEWYLVTNLLLKSNLSSSDIPTHALSNLADSQQSMSHLKALKDQEVWPPDATFASCPRIFDQIWALHAEVEVRVVPLIYCPMIETKQENYVGALKIITKEIQKIVLEEQETSPTPA